MYISRQLLMGCALWVSATVVHAESLYVSQWLPEGHPLSSVMQDWADQVTQATNGSVNFKVLPQPVSAPAHHYNAVRDGLADVAMTVIGYTPGRFPLTEIVEMPLMADSAEANSLAFYRMVTQNPAIMQDFDEVKVLALFSHGPGVVFNSKKPVKTLEDLQSLKFRVGGGVVNEVAKQLEANASLKPATESYELLSNGVMDGVWMPFESLITYNLDELVEYATVFPGGLYSSAFMVLMNKDRWDALSAEEQASIEEISGEAYSRALGQAFDKRDAKGRALAQEAGIQIEQASDELIKDVQSKIAPLQNRWIELATSRGIEEPQQVIESYRGEALK